MTAFYDALVSYLGTLFKWLLDGVLWVIGKVLYVIFDGLLTVIDTIFKSIDVSSYLTSNALSWANMPSQLIWLVNQIGIPQGLTIIASAISLRMLINLIPAEFTRI